ncbi:rubredoxin [Dyadobacter tibetensis]|uniref:rubredoxin n=1 Tax=Dyadobacter tibetensis TaxID=1211851 RepID=UPI00046FFEBB|nr:rubredoxin [Dyadobacter tibetensis]
MRDYFIFKINLPGGIVSPGTLYHILKQAYQLGVRYVRVGSRQELYLEIHNDEVRLLEKELKKMDLHYEINTNRTPNIISSYCGEEVFRTGQWLGPQEYHTILDSLDYSPTMKINISDSNQSFTPFFTGNLNFISSQIPHYWHLYLRKRQQNTLHKWPELIYTNHIGQVAAELEEILSKNPDLTPENLQPLVQQSKPYIALPPGVDLQLPAFSLPYYEGFNRYESRTWLGLYQRDEQFPIAFLMDLCDLCLRSRIGEICTTPWRSLIIKGIEDQYRTQWSTILAKHHINMRHSASELAWQTEEYAPEANLLKKRILRYMEREDTRTFGLCFGIQTRPKSEVFGSVLIRKRMKVRIGPWALFPVYDIFHTDQFNPNNRSLIPFELGLWKAQLPGQIEKLCRRFNNQRSYDEQNRMVQQPAMEEVLPIHTVFECPECLSHYDPLHGDPLQGIDPHTAFTDLPVEYSCLLCGGSKDEMTVKQIAANNSYGSN